MMWAGDVVHMGEIRNAYNILFGKPGWGGDHLEDLYVNGRII
jgi:hypothetical protein